MQRVVAMFWSVLVTLIPLQVLAQTAAAEPTQKWWQALLIYVVTVVGGIAAPVISYLVITLLKKKNIVVDAALVDGLVEKGINFAEEQAAKALKTGQKPDASAAKMQTAINAVDLLLEQFKLKKLASDKLKVLIESKLGAARNGDATAPAVSPAPASTEPKS